MKTIKLQLDYLQGPIWISDFETGTPITGVAIHFIKKEKK